MQELIAAMDGGVAGMPIGSLWTTPDTQQMFMVLHHANIASTQGPIPSVVVQAIPTGEAWVQPIELVGQNNWINIGFVWDRGVNV
jgi:hypothetical protein